MPFFDLVYVENKGVAFGLFSKLPINFIWVSLLSIVLIVFLLYRFLDKPNPLLFSLLIAGALGNIWDRFNYGFVIDFIKIGSFYVFNIADAAITVSAFWIIILVIYENKKKFTISSE